MSFILSVSGLLFLQLFLPAAVTHLSRLLQHWRSSHNLLKPGRGHSAFTTVINCRICEWRGNMIKHIYRYKILPKSFLWKFHHFDIIKSAQRGCQCSRSLAFPCNQNTKRYLDKDCFPDCIEMHFFNFTDLWIKLGPHIYCRHHLSRSLRGCLTEFSSFLHFRWAEVSLHLLTHSRWVFNSQ